MVYEVTRVVPTITDLLDQIIITARVDQRLEAALVQVGQDHLEVDHHQVVEPEEAETNHL